MKRNLVMSTLSIEPEMSSVSPNPTFVLRARHAGRAAAWLGVLFVLTIPLSWLLKIPILRTDIPVFTPTHSLGFFFSLFLGISVVLLHHRHAVGIVTVVSWIVLVGTGIVLLEYFTPGELPFAHLIRILDPIEDPNKIAPNGALCLFLTSFSTLLFATRGARTVYVAHVTALLVFFVAAIALIGHAYSVEPLYGIADYSQMSVPGALSHLFFASALLCVIPERGLIRILVTEGPAGVMGRRLYGTAIFLPPVLGFLALFTSVAWKWYDLPFAMVLLVMSSIVLFVGVVALTSLRLERADRSRQYAEEGLRESRERLRELSAHIQVMQEEERVRIAREVHDELGQSLTALKMDVAMLRKNVPASEDVDRRMNAMVDVINTTIRSVQRISAELRPSVLDDLGLAAAIEWQAREFEKRSGIQCQLELPEYEIATHPSQATALFRVFQETLTNVVRHANARLVNVQLRETSGIGECSAILLRVHDDGVGIDDQSLRSGLTLGLMGMRERTALAGGTLELESTPGAGMTVTVTMPSTP